jgi:hypothetical protein
VGGVWDAALASLQNEFVRRYGVPGAPRQSGTAAAIAAKLNNGAVGSGTAVDVGRST